DALALRSDRLSRTLFAAGALSRSFGVAAVRGFHGPAAAAVPGRQPRNGGRRVHARCRKGAREWGEGRGRDLGPDAARLPGDRVAAASGAGGRACGTVRGKACGLANDARVNCRARPGAGDPKGGSRMDKVDSGSTSRREFLRAAGLGALALGMNATAEAATARTEIPAARAAGDRAHQPYNILFFLTDQERFFRPGELPAGYQ